jgi:phenol 2-monooxygenase
MFKSLGLLDALLQHAVSITERAMWAEVPREHAPASSPDENNGSTPTSTRKMMRVARLDMGGSSDARSYGLLGLRQGTIEDVLSTDLHKSAPEALIRGFQVTDVRIDESNSTFPVVVVISKVAGDGTVAQPPQARTIRCRHLVGADGAHSTVRKKAGIAMEGDNTDQIFGVVDLAVDSDFPDVRRCVMLQNSSGMVMIIPRERDAHGEWLTRFYVDVKELEMQRRQQAAERENRSASASGLTAAEVANAVSGQSDSKAPTVIIKNTRQKSTITEDDILNRLEEIFLPFRMKRKAGTAINWSTSYAIGQRVASEFVRADSTGMPRIFLVGDGESYQMRDVSSNPSALDRMGTFRRSQPHAAERRLKLIPSQLATRTAQS